jgi:hypothetical protein
MDVHHFDGSGRGLFVLARGPSGEFRLPVDENQAAIILSQFGDLGEDAEDEDKEVASPVVPRRAQNPRQEEDEERLVLSGFSMGRISDRDEDDDL